MEHVFSSDVLFATWKKNASKVACRSDGVEGEVR